MGFIDGITKGDGRAEAITKFQESLAAGFAKLEARLESRGGQFFAGTTMLPLVLVHNIFEKT